MLQLLLLVTASQAGVCQGQSGGGAATAAEAESGSPAAAGRGGVVQRTAILLSKLPRRFASCVLCKARLHGRSERKRAALNSGRGGEPNES